MVTPEFLAWSIEYRCSVRGLQDGSNPERTERQLRAARAVSDAVQEGRVFDGVCVDPPDGFRIDEALALYGGLAAVQSACGSCPANASSRQNRGALAGCFGILPLSMDTGLFHKHLDEAIDRRNLADEIEQHFSDTRPRWYGLWMNSPLGAAPQSMLLSLLSDVEAADGSLARGIHELRLGLETSLAANLNFYAALYPPGRIAGTSWQLRPHCPRCHALWRSTVACSICGYTGSPAPIKKRHARGRRPYRPLARLLGERQASEFLVRCAAFQEPRASPDQPHSQLPPALKNSPPAD